VQVADAAAGKPFRMRVQWVNRPNLDFRGFCGTIASGAVHPGDPVLVTSSGQTSRVARIVTMDGDLQKAVAGQAVTLTLTDEIDISRGDTIAAPDERPYHADRLEAKVVWLHEEALQPGRSYLLKAGASTTPAQVADLKFKVNVNTLQQESGTILTLNEVGVCSLSLDRPVTFDSYRENRGTGSFILIDRLTNATVAAGMIHQPLLRAAGPAWQDLDLDKQARAELKGQQARILWFTGRAGADQVALARLVEKKLHAMGKHTALLDLENLGRVLNGTLATDADPLDQNSRIAAVARLFLDAGLLVLIAAGTPTRSDLRRLRAQFDPGEFVEVSLGTPAMGTEEGEVSEESGIIASDPKASPVELAERIASELFRWEQKIAADALSAASL